MNRAQKAAWVFIISTLVALAISVVAVVIAYGYVGLPGALHGFALMGLTGLPGVLSLLFIRKDPDGIAADERDQLFHRRAALAGFTAAYLAVGVACMGPFIAFGPHASISVTWLPQIFIVAGIVHYFAHSLAILSQYGWKKAEMPS